MDDTHYRVFILNHYVNVNLCYIREADFRGKMKSNMWFVWVASLRVPFTGINHKNKEGDPHNFCNVKVAYGG